MCFFSGCEAATAKGRGATPPKMGGKAMAADVAVVVAIVAAATVFAAVASFPVAWFCFITICYLRCVCVLLYIYVCVCLFYTVLIPLFVNESYCRCVCFDMI